MSKRYRNVAKRNAWLLLSNVVFCICVIFLCAHFEWTRVYLKCVHGILLFVGCSSLGSIYGEDKAEKTSTRWISYYWGVVSFPLTMSAIEIIYPYYVWGIFTVPMIHIFFEICQFTLSLFVLKLLSICSVLLAKVSMDKSNSIHRFDLCLAQAICYLLFFWICTNRI